MEIVLTTSEIFIAFYSLLVATILLVCGRLSSIFFDDAIFWMIGLTIISVVGAVGIIIFL